MQFKLNVKGAQKKTLSDLSKEERIEVEKEIRETDAIAQVMERLMQKYELSQTSIKKLIVEMAMRDEGRNNGTI